MAMKFGNTIVITEIPGDLPHKLYQTDKRDVQIIDSRKVLAIGSRKVELDPQYQIYLTSKENLNP